MDTNEKQRHIDIQNLKKYPEFYALQKELEAFCFKLDSISDIDLTNPSRVSLNEEVFGRQWASTKIKDLLGSLGLVDKTHIVRDMTME